MRVKVAPDARPATMPDKLAARGGRGRSTRASRTRAPAVVSLERNIRDADGRASAPRAKPLGVALMLSKVGVRRGRTRHVPARPATRLGVVYAKQLWVFCEAKRLSA